MATPAIDLPIQALVEDSALALQGNNPGELPGEAPFVQNDISQLAAAIGTRLAAAQTVLVCFLRPLSTTRLPVQRKMASQC